MGSWIILATFITTALYLILSGRNFSPMPMLSSVATAMLLCFFGLLLTAALNALLAKFSTPIENSSGQGVIVSLGVLLGLIARHFWKQSSPSRKGPAE